MSELTRGFRGGKASPPAIHRANALRFKLLDVLAHRAEIRVEQPDKSSAKQKVKPAEGDESGRIIEHATGRVLEEAPLFKEAVLHDVAKTLTMIQALKNFVERFTPLQSGGIRCHQNRLQHLGYIVEGDRLTIEILRRAKGKVLNEQPVDFIAIGGGLVGFSQVALNERPQTLFTRVQDFGTDLAKLVREQILVDLVEPI